MGVLIEYENDSVIAFLEGEIDHHTASKIRTDIDYAVTLKRTPKLVLDFSAVTFMDSSAVGLIMGRYRLLQSWGGILQAQNLSEQNYKMMKIAGMQELCVLRKKDKNEKN